MTAQPPVRPPGPFRFSREQYHRLGDLGCFAGRRAFLLDGAIWEQGPMDPPHANALEVLVEALRTALGPGWRFRVQTPLHLDPFNNPMPDLAVVAGRPGYHPDHRPPRPSWSRCPTRPSKLT